MNNKKIFFSIIVLLVLGVIAAAILRSGSIGGPALPGRYDDFVFCLKDKGAVFYGAFWCSHCQAQKKLFGSSQKLLPYVECSTVNGAGQLQICKDKNITGYPTWDFADQSRLSGEISLSQLAEKTSCKLPE